MEATPIQLEELLKVPSQSRINSQTIATIIPAYNEEDSIEATIESLLSQTRPPNAIFIMVNNCSDETFYVANAFAGVHELKHRADRFTCVITVVDMGMNEDKKVGALNLGWTMAEGYDYILGVDGDTVLDKKCVQNLMAEMIEDSRIGGISAIYGFDQAAIRGPGGGFLVRSQRFQFAGFNLDNLLRSRNMAVLGGQCSLLSTSAMRATMVANRQTTPWVTDSEIEDSLLSIQLRTAGFRTKISASARANVGAMTTFRSLNAQQVKWNAGGVELMLQNPLHPNLRLRWRENVGMFTNLLSRIMFILLVAAALSVGVFQYEWWWLIPPVVSIVLNTRIAMAMKDHTFMDITYALFLIPGEIYIAVRGVHFIEAWGQIIGRQEHDNWAAQANAENGAAKSGKVVLAIVAVAAILAALTYGWLHLEPIVQNVILSVGWTTLAVLTILQTVLMLGKVFRNHKGFKV
jgi:biofilm PGA synthesis N-glycosyltransferase PgaC